MFRRNGRAQKSWPAWKRVGALIGGAVPACALLWTIWSFFHPHETIGPLDCQYLLFKGNALSQIATGKKSVFKSAQIENPLLVPNALQQNFIDAFGKPNKRTIRTVTYLAITNAGKDEVSKIEFDRASGVPTQFNLLGGSTLLVCMRITSLDSHETEKKIQVDNVTFTGLDGHGQVRKVNPVPNEADMSQIPGTPVLHGYPK